jgi:murein DD-endopeptidase MepM/ murein hydrolase activator NlpD
MAKKFLSVIIVPHTKTSTKTFALSRRAFKLTVAGAGLFVLVLGIFLVDYLSMGLLRQRYRVISRESTEQKARIADYEKTIGDLQSTVARMEALAKKLNVMTGLKSPDVLTGPAGIGGGAPSEAESDIASGPPVSGPQVFSPGSMQTLSQRALSIEGNLNGLVSSIESRNIELASTPSIMPTAGWISSPFGRREDPFTGQWQMHWGLDISTNTGNPIVATADGIVIKVQEDKYLGKNVTISHGNGITTVYGHMSKFGTKAGAKVKRGDIIGYVGMTGKAVGPHVHYEVRRDGKPVNPYNYILEE